MGEIADGMINGDSCQWCGQYFEETDKATSKSKVVSHGFPVVCKECFDDATKRERKSVVRATYNTF